ncbi:MAG: hypothetical protein LBV26_03255 [Bacteroidales bacterium]|jgi:hypothetical protein|nr:hypothetical protein [Bacteroidales bacterium]
MRTLFTILLTILFTSKIFGTPQIPDKIIYNGKEYRLLHNTPMENYFKKYPDKNPQKGNIPLLTGLWRGYVATFEIKGNQLYLKDIEVPTEGCIDNKSYYGLSWKSVLNEIFPNTKLVKIDWMTGLLILPTGEIVEHEQRYGDYPTYENYILLEIDKGILKKEKQVGHKEYEEFKENSVMLFCKWTEKAIIFTL